MTGKKGDLCVTFFVIFVIDYVVDLKVYNIGSRINALYINTIIAVM